MICFVCNKTIEEGANKLDFIKESGSIVYFSLSLASTKKSSPNEPTEVFRFHLGCFAETSGWAKPLLERFREMQSQ